MHPTAEIVMNLWYIVDENGFVYSLRARCYIGTGTDEEKLAMLRERAETDYLIAQCFPIPERFHTTFHTAAEQKKMAVVGMDSVTFRGGPQVLFEHAFQALEAQLPATTKLTIRQDPLVVMTALFSDNGSELRPQTVVRGYFERQGED